MTSCKITNRDRPILKLYTVREEIHHGDVDNFLTTNYTFSLMVNAGN